MSVTNGDRTSLAPAAICLGLVGGLRRRQILASLVGTCLTVSAARAYEPEIGSIQRPRSLYLSRWGQDREVCYWRDGHLQAEGYATVCWLLRDEQAQAQAPMDIALLNILSGMQQQAREGGCTQAIQVLSGFRSPATNARTKGASRQSMHMYGKAVDLRLPGVSSSALLRMAHSLTREDAIGVVRAYGHKTFVHVDTGSSRCSYTDSSRLTTTNV